MVVTINGTTGISSSGNIVTTGSGFISSASTLNSILPRDYGGPDRDYAYDRLRDRKRV
jgi:hypothetical protein